MRPMAEARRLAAAAVLAFAVACASAQPAVPPQAIAQFQQVIGDRTEAAVILGGDYGAVGGIYTFRGGRVAQLDVSKIGGGGEVAALRPLGIGDMQWAPILLGNVGHMIARNDFDTGYLQGNQETYNTLAVQGGAGARFYFTDDLSLAPTFAGMYGHIENSFTAQNAIGQMVKTAATGTYVDWDLDTWTVSPALELRYDWQWGRTSFELSSRYNYYHTESFHSSSFVIGVTGNSQTWENKIDVDAPLGWKVLGRELHAGGFFSRTELYGGISQGLDTGHFYTVNGRFVMDFLGKVWKVRWFGVGASYFIGGDFNGWSAGIDMRFQF